MSPSNRDQPMPLWQHLMDLRRCLIQSILGIVVGMGLAWFFRHSLLAFLMLPIRDYLPGDSNLTVLSLTEAFVFYLKLSLFAGIFIASPWVLFQIWRFIAPGLYAHEKRVLISLIAFTTVCFLVGGYFGYRVIMPLTARFLIDISREFRLLLTTTNYMNFFLRLILGVAIIFEMPVFTLVLARLGILQARTMWRFWKIAVIGSFVVAAVITPSGDMVTQTVLAVPLVGLYFLSVLVAWIFGRRPQRSVMPSEAKTPSSG